MVGQISMHVSLIVHVDTLFQGLAVMSEVGFYLLNPLLRIDIPNHY